VIASKRDSQLCGVISGLLNGISGINIIESDAEKSAEDYLTKYSEVLLSPNFLQFPKPYEELAQL
jgi:hypothetical protein